MRFKKKIVMKRLLFFLTFLNSLTLTAQEKNSSEFLPTISDIDGNTYKIVEIGQQYWMQSNLKVSRYRNGDSIPTGLLDSIWSKFTKGAAAQFENKFSNESIYGKLYNWYAVNDPKGLCPEGWHIPTNSEWNQLINQLGEKSVAGGKMKSKGTNFWKSPNKKATNESGFSALPGGCRNEEGDFSSLNIIAFFWSRTESTFGKAVFWSLINSSSSVIKYEDYKSVGFSVRCLRD